MIDFEPSKLKLFTERQFKSYLKNTLPMKVLIAGWCVADRVEMHSLYFSAKLDNTGYITSNQKFIAQT